MSALTHLTQFRHKRKARRAARRADRDRRLGPRQPVERKQVILASILALVLLLGLVFWFTSARIVGEPVEIAYGPGDAAFDDSLGPLLGAEFTGGNEVKLMSNGDEFFPAMLKDLAAAKRSITLETYIWSSGKISDQFIAVLVDRARQGVKVHVMVDGMGALNFDDADQRRLLDAGVQFVMYGREHWWQVKPNINHRTHRKLLIVDGLIGYTGGMCIDDSWLGNADQVDRWREVQLRVEGPVVRQMQSVFITNWLQTTSRLLVGPDYLPPVESVGRGAAAQCYKSGPNEDPENARISYLLGIASARKSIRIQHAYFVPDDLAIDMLLDARRRGVEIEVVIPEINDSRFGRAASRSRWGKLLEAGVKFHRYMPAMYHCKMMIVDDLFLTIGSVNFDNRSFGINDEVNVNTLDADVARQGLKLFEDDKRNSQPLTLEEFRARPWWQKVIDHFCGLFRSQL
jgi:cardiolipin synthase